MVWRLGTFNPEAPVLSRVLYGAELFGFTTALLHIFMCWRLSERHAGPPRVVRTVDVFIPTYNESVDLVRKTLMAALARELGCRYLARSDNTHAKAGNLNHGL